METAAVVRDTRRAVAQEVRHVSQAQAGIICEKVSMLPRLNRTYSSVARDTWTLCQSCSAHRSDKGGMDCAPGTII